MNKRQIIGRALRKTKKKLKMSDLPIIGNGGYIEIQAGTGSEYKPKEKDTHNEAYDRAMKGL